jgi:hypothetical protein
VADRRNAYLLILGHREGLAWVLRNQKMAFSAARASDGKRLAVGDRLFLYTSRGCFHNPTRDRGRVIGEATVASELRALPEPLLIGEREFAYTCDLELESLAPFRQGVVIANLVSDLKTFPDASTWSFKLRRPLLPLEPADATLIGRKLARLVGPPDETIDDYLEWIALLAGR